MGAVVKQFLIISKQLSFSDKPEEALKHFDRSSEQIFCIKKKENTIAGL